MPYFDENPLAKLALQPGAAAAELDLQGLSSNDAMQQVERLLLAADRPASVLIRFDAAANDGRETLFLPLGRRLLAARRDGLLKSCLPTADGNAYYVRLSEDE